MGQLIFAILWTVLAVAIVLATSFNDLTQTERIILLILPLFGLVAAWMSWLRVRRRRSLRVETEDGGTFYVWIELNGQECRSDRDPRPDWDAEDGDGDGEVGGD